MSPRRSWSPVPRSCLLAPLLLAALATVTACAPAPEDDAESSAGASTIGARFRSKLEPGFYDEESLQYPRHASVRIHDTAYGSQVISGVLLSSTWFNEAVDVRGEKTFIENKGEEVVRLRDSRIKLYDVTFKRRPRGALNGTYRYAPPNSEEPLESLTIERSSDSELDLSFSISMAGTRYPGRVLGPDPKFANRVSGYSVEVGGCVGMLHVHVDGKGGFDVDLDLDYANYKVPSEFQRRMCGKFPESSFHFFRH